LIFPLGKITQMQSWITESYQIWLVLIVSGALAGFLNAFLGLGGMSIYVPLLIYILHTELGDRTQLISTVLINSFSVVVIVGLASWISDHSHKTIHYRKVPPLTSGATCGVIFGFSIAILTGLFGSMDLIFGFYLIAIGIFSLLQKIESAPNMYSYRNLFGIGLAGGALGAFAGFAGNSVFIPLLRDNGLNIKESIATAQLIGLEVAALMVLLIGMTFSFHNIHAGACIALAISGFGGSYLGGRLKKLISGSYINLALVISYWITGGLLVYRHSNF